jgi:hypothetical protein
MTVATGFHRDVDKDILSPWRLKAQSAKNSRANLIPIAKSASQLARRAFTGFQVSRDRATGGPQAVHRSTGLQGPRSTAGALGQGTQAVIWAVDPSWTIPPPMAIVQHQNPHKLTSPHTLTCPFDSADARPRNVQSLEMA